MDEILMTRLHSYIIQNNPELLLSLQGGGRIGRYLEQKVATVGPLIDQLIAENTDPYFIEEECLELLTKDLRPSKFHYVSGILLREFPALYEKLKEAGALTFVVSEIIALSINLFEAFGFTEDKKDDNELDEALKATLHHYFDKPEAARA